MKRVLAVFVVAVLFFGALGVWFTRNQSSAVQAETERQTIPVSRGDIVSSVSATGNLEAEEEIELSFEMTGIVEEVFVKRGQEVQAGDPLAKLNTASLELAIAQAEVSLEEAKTELAQVQDEGAQHLPASAPPSWRRSPRRALRALVRFEGDAPDPCPRPPWVRDRWD